MTEKTNESAPETSPEATTTVPVFEYEGFSFGGGAFEEDIPEDATRAQPRANALPFPAMFSAVEGTVKTTGKKAPWFIPASFWKARANATTQISSSYQKDKLRGQFNKWRDDAPEARKGFTLLLVHHTGKEVGGGPAEEGVRMWLVYTAPAAPEAPAPAPEDLAVAPAGSAAPKKATAAAK